MQHKLTVLLDPELLTLYKAFCKQRGHKQSTLAARLIKDHLTGENFVEQLPLLTPEVVRGTTKGRASIPVSSSPKTTQ